MLEKSRKNLMVYSYAILALSLLYVARMIITYFVSDDLTKMFKSAAQELNVTDDVLNIVTTVIYITVAVVIAIVMIVNMYVGIRGVELAKGTYNGKAYMFWVAAATIVSATFTLNAFLTLTNMGSSVVDNIVQIANNLILTLFLAGAWFEAIRIRRAQ